ncbi:MAG: sensor histidine kinase [Dehalococcoidia bacterium]
MTALARAANLARRVTRPAAPAHVRYLRRARVRLTLWYAGVLLVLLIPVGVTVYLVLAQVLRSEVDSDLRAAAATFAGREIDIHQPAPLPARPAPALPNAAPPIASGTQSLYDGAYPDVFVLFLDTHRLQVDNPRGVLIDRLPDAAAMNAAGGGKDDLRTIQRAGQSYRLFTRLVQQGGQPIGILQVGKPLQQLDHNLHAMVLALIGGGLTALVLAAAGGWLVAGRALRPVQASWQRQQAFVADASHELRTPLAIVRADAEVLLRSPRQSIEENRELVEDIVGVTDNLSTLVADMLTLTRLDAGQLPLNRSEFDAGELLADVAEQTSRLLVGRELTVHVNAPPGLGLLADRDRVLQVLRIFVDNAIRHTPDGGSISLSATDGGARVCLTVADTGAGIPAEHLAHVFERFYRADQARSRIDGGAGLGLAIARGFVEAHGGKLRIVSTLSAGTAITAELPAAPRPPGPQ